MTEHSGRVVNEKCLVHCHLASGYEATYVTRPVFPNVCQLPNLYNNLDTKSVIMHNNWWLVLA